MSITIRVPPVDLSRTTFAYPGDRPWPPPGLEVQAPDGMVYTQPEEDGPDHRGQHTIFCQLVGDGDAPCDCADFPLRPGAA